MPTVITEEEKVSLLEQKFLILKNNSREQEIRLRKLEENNSILKENYSILSEAIFKIKAVTEERELLEKERTKEYDILKNYAHNIIHNSGEPKITNTKPGFYLYRTESDPPLINVLIVHNNGERETLKLTEIAKEEWQNNVLIVLSNQWPTTEERFSDDLEKFIVNSVHSMVELCERDEELSQELDKIPMTSSSDVVSQAPTNDSRTRLKTIGATLGTATTAVMSAGLIGSLVGLTPAAWGKAGFLIGLCQPIPGWGQAALLAACVVVSLIGLYYLVPKAYKCSQRLLVSMRGVRQADSATPESPLPSQRHP
jgi:hypothetical protein